MPSLRPTSRDDAALCVRIAAGDQEAFEAVFRAHHAALCDLVESYVRSRAVAEEVVQDLFFVLWSKRESLEVRESLRAYLFTAARNRALRHLRHQTVVRRWFDAARHEDPATAPSADASPPGMLDADDLAALRGAIDALPPRARAAVLFRWQHEMSHAEVAAAMDISVKGVEKLLTSALKKLRVSLGVAKRPPR